MRFSETRFLDDLRATALTLGAPYSEDMARRVISAYAESFASGAVVWKTTGRPGDHLNYRFFARDSVDTIEVALRSGLLGEPTRASGLIRAWSELYDAPQSCDFDMTNGMAKTWAYLGAMRPTDEVLDQRFVPDSVRRRLPAFHAAGLDHVRFVAVDHRQDKANVYFRVRGPIDIGKADRILELVGVAPAIAQVELIRTFAPTDFCVAVTVSLGTGTLERACFYALKLPVLPELPRRLEVFFASAPSLDPTLVNVAGWSFGRGGGTYVKAEKSYCGDMAGLLADTDCYFSGSTHRDPVLAG